MADVLGLLREYHIGKKDIVETANEIIFGEFAWPKTAKTNYAMWGTGKEGAPKDYYTLNCIVYLLRNVNLPHSKYVRQAATADIPVVRLPDRRELLAYLNGETNTAPNIDRTVPFDISVRRPISKGLADVQALQRSDHLDTDGPLDSKRARRSSYESDQTKTNETFYGKGSVNAEQSGGSALPQAISLDQIQSLRAKFRANKQVVKPDSVGDQLCSPNATGVDDDPVLQAAGIAGYPMKQMDPSRQGPNSQLIVNVEDQQLSLARSADPKRSAVLASDADTVRVMSLREKRWRTRSTILQSQGKTFYENIVLGILRNVMLKENAHLAPDRRDAYGGPVGAMSTFYKTPLTTAQQRQNRQPAMQYSRYDQERFNAGREDTAGFRIDTMSSYHGKALASMVGSGGAAAAMTKSMGAPVGSVPTPQPTYSAPVVPKNGPSALIPPTTPGYETPRGVRTPRDPRALGLSTPVAGGLTPDPYRGARPVPPRQKPRASRVPIIIIPAAPTSLITMVNATDILQDLHFVSADEKKTEGSKRENEILIHRKKPDGRTVPYRVIDQPSRIQLEEWNRVVAVFVQGQAWQFKGWPIGSDPAVIFSMRGGKQLLPARGRLCVRHWVRRLYNIREILHGSVHEAVKGFHIKYANMPLDPNVAKWNVQVINMDRRRHLDKVNFQSVWDNLDKFIAKNKPFLRF